MISSEVVTISNGMSASFLYQSAKDVLGWHKLSIKEHIKTVMRIGDYINLPQKDFDRIRDEETFNRVTVDDLKKVLNGNDKSKS